MKCERNVTVMTLLWHDYLVFGFGNCVDDTPIETGLTEKVLLQPCRQAPTLGYLYHIFNLTNLYLYYKE